MKSRRIMESVAILVLLLCVVGCGKQEEQETIRQKKSGINPVKIVYVSDTPESECQLCGAGKGTLLPAYWGEDNVGIIDLNTFEVGHLMLNEYDDYGNRIKPRHGSSTGYLSTGEDGMTVWGSEDSSRGYYSGEAHMRNEKGLELEKASKFLCTECLNEMLNQCYDDTYLQLGVVNFKTRKIRLLEKNVKAFTFDDFYVDSDYYEKEYETNTERGFQLLIFYCPPRDET